MKVMDYTGVLDKVEDSPQAARSIVVECVNCGKKGKLVNRDPYRDRCETKVYCGYCITRLQGAA